jgi:hypothetical protein
MKTAFIKRNRNHAKPITSRAQRLIPFIGVNYFDILGLANCATPDSVFNTGIPTCDIKKKKIRGVIFTDPDVVFTGADVSSVASFISAVKAKTIAARGGRVYPVWDLQNFADNTGDPATGAIGNLTTATGVVNDAVPAFSFGYNGTEARHQKMAAMNSMSLKVFFVDAGWTVYGYKNAEGSVIGFDVQQAYADVTKFPVDNFVDQYKFRITLADIGQYRDLSQYVVTNSGLLSAVGLVNVYLKQYSLVSNVAKVQALAEGGTNMQTLHGTIIAGLTWNAINSQTGAAVSLTSITEDGTGKGFVLTIDNTTWTGMASGDSIVVYGPTASALSAAGVKPYEFMAYLIRKP